LSLPVFSRLVHVSVPGNRNIFQMKRSTKLSDEPVQIIKTV
jgi:hypothetical protein